MSAKDEELDAIERDYKTGLSLEDIGAKHDLKMADIVKHLIQSKRVRFRARDNMAFAIMKTLLVVEDSVDHGIKRSLKKMAFGKSFKDTFLSLVDGTDIVMKIKKGRDRARKRELRQWMIACKILAGNKLKVNERNIAMRVKWYLDISGVMSLFKNKGKLL